MKRFVSLDFARGVGILGVLLIHIVNATYDASWTQNLGTAPIPMIILLLVLMYFGGFVGMFVLLSAIGNFVSINSQLARLREKGMEEGTARRIIMKQQVIRGTFTWIIGYISEALLNGILLKLLIGEWDPEPLWMYIFGTQILQTIGLCTIFSCALYILFLKWHWTRRKISTAFLLLALVILGIRGVIEIVLKQVPGLTLSFWKNIETRPWWENLGLVLLAPFIGRIFPLVPYFAMACIGAIIGLHIHDGKFNLHFLKQVQLLAMAMFVAGLIAGVFSMFILANDVGEGLGYLLESSTITGFLFINGGALWLLKMVLYRVEYKNKGEKFARHTVFFRRFGMVTLTLWAFQWVMVFPLYLIQLLTGWNVINQGLNGYQLLCVLLLITLFWHLLLCRWERIDFRYSFEWLMVRFLSKSKEDAGRRMRVQEVLYHPEVIAIVEEARGIPTNSI